MARLILTNDIWTRESVKNDPETCYLFGDNLIGRGNAGQACIRGLPNAHGIPTKRLPAMTSESFFIERKGHTLEDSKEIVGLVVPFIRNIPSFNTYVMSFQIGRGLARFNQLAPLAYNLVLVEIMLEIGQR